MFGFEQVIDRSRCLFFLLRRRGSGNGKGLVCDPGIQESQGLESKGRREGLIHPGFHRKTALGGSGKRPFLERTRSILGRTRREKMQGNLVFVVFSLVLLTIP
jgi:hypothetical protein